VLARDAKPSIPDHRARIRKSALEVVLVAPCGFRMDQAVREMRELAQDPAFASLPATRDGRVVVIDGSAFFNRPGPRLVDSAELAAMAIHPDRFQGRFTFGADDIVFWSAADSAAGAQDPPH
jgi:iron complex transport system substrate-binding protein